MQQLVLYRPECLTTRTPPALAADGGQVGCLIFINYLVGKEIRHSVNLFLSLKCSMYQWSVPIFHTHNAKIMKNKFKSKLQGDKSERYLRRLG